MKVSKKFVCSLLSVMALSMTAGAQSDSKDAGKLVPDGAQCRYLIGMIECEAGNYGGAGILDGVEASCKSKVGFQMSKSAEGLSQIQTVAIQAKSRDGRNTGTLIGGTVRGTLLVATGGASEFIDKKNAAYDEMARAEQRLRLLVTKAQVEEMELKGIKDCEGMIDNSKTISKISHVTAD